MTDINLITIWQNLVVYILSPVSIVGGVALIFKLSKKIGNFESDFIHVKDDASDLKKNVRKLEKCVVEIQTILRVNKIDIKESLSIYGLAKSPMKLRNKFRSLILKSGLNKEVSKNKKRLINWLQKQKPKTGLDAQNSIIELVASDQIEKYIDTTEFKKFLYQEGKTTKDYYGILAVYLFEILIPKVLSAKD